MDRLARSPARTLAAFLVTIVACAPASVVPPDRAPLAMAPRTGMFTHLPVDFDELCAARTFSGTTPITPFFNYDNTAHAEGPRKWYLYGPLDHPLAVYLPSRAAIARDGIRVSERTAAVEVDDEPCLLDVQTWFRVTSGGTTDVRLFFMHLCLRRAILARVEAGAGGEVQFDAGTHIGWIHHPPWQSLDFGVEDELASSGRTADPQHWWNRRANPFDYFTPELQRRILAAYAPVYARLRQRGEQPYSDLTDSRVDIGVPGEIWGVWFKDDLRDPFAQHRVDWSIVNFVPRARLHAATYWRVLSDDPELAGLYTENGQGERQGAAPYQGASLGRARLYLQTGDARAGTARLEQMSGGQRTVHLRFRVIGNDRLEMTSGFGPPIYFRRAP